MLEVQNFIKSNENWRELLRMPPYSLRIQEDDNYVLLKYSQIDSDFSEKICLECRGIILEKATLRIVRLAFEKFFNFGEKYAAPIDWDSIIVREKIDGSLMSLWFDKGKWHLSTNGTLDAYTAPIEGISPYKTYGELFDAAAQNSGLDYSKLDKYCCYTFELVSPFNRVVIPYNETKLYHLSTRDMVSLNEIDDEIGVEKPRLYNLNSKEDCLKIVEEMDSSHEGVVVLDRNGNRVKVKTPLYFELHKKANNGNISVEKIVEIIRAGEQEEFLTYFPWYKETFDKIELRIKFCNWMAALIDEAVEKWKKSNEKKFESDREMKKDFALLANEYSFKELYFIAYRENLVNYLNKTDTNRWFKLFKTWFKNIV